MNPIRRSYEVASRHRSFLPLKQEQGCRHKLQANVDQVDQLQGSLRRMMAELQELAQGRTLLLPPGLMGVIFGYHVHLYGQPPEALFLVCRTSYPLPQPTLWINLDP